MLRTLLLNLANSPRLARRITSLTATRRLARRFVPGEHLDDALAAARRCNQAGMAVSLDHLGENVLSRADAERSRDEYLQILDRISAERLDANISVKLTSLGLDIERQFCADNLGAVVNYAAALANFVRVDMEGSAYTENTIGIVTRFRSRTAAIGTVVQAYLFRSEQDIADLLKLGCRIRLVKGAYREPAGIAFQSRREVEANFVRLAELLLGSGLFHALATHDPRMIDAAIGLAAQRGLAKDQFEFQMLYGIRTDLQARLVREGFRVRIYIPYGVQWFPYFMRRLAERPANLLFFLKNLVRGK